MRLDVFRSFFRLDVFPLARQRRFVLYLLAMDKTGYIGVFDSGVGGISVLKRLVSLMPHERFVFYGDSANAPYGDKPTEWVLHRTRLVVEGMMDTGAKAVVIACNTATSVAAATLRADHPDFPIIGIEPACNASQINHILETLAGLELKEKESVYRTMERILEADISESDILVFSTFWNESLENRAQELRQKGNNVTHISLRKEAIDFETVDTASAV